MTPPCVQQCPAFPHLFRCAATGPGVFSHAWHGLLYPGWGFRAFGRWSLSCVLLFRGGGARGNAFVLFVGVVLLPFTLRIFVPASSFSLVVSMITPRSSMMSAADLDSSFVLYSPASVGLLPSIVTRSAR